MKNYFIILTLLIFTSCSGFGDAAKVLRNEKTKTTDEFLVKKREPLVLPPNYEKIPLPGEETQDKMIDDKEKIRKIIKGERKQDINTNSVSSTEESILNQIRK